MALDISIYGSTIEADEYFASRLHSEPWDDATAADQTKALLTSRRLIDNLAFKGHKHAVWVFLQTTPKPWMDPTNGTFDHKSAEQYHQNERAANASQALEFPRGADTAVPEPIRIAQYELALSLLDGVDPQMELENLAVTAQGHAEVRTHYERNMVPIEHLINLVPNSLAWSLLKPFLRDDQALRLSRVS
jgi:hypothetical protein